MNYLDIKTYNDVHYLEVAICETFNALLYAEYCDENNISLSGKNLFDEAPKPKRKHMKCAKKLLKAWLSQNDMNLDQLFSHFNERLNCDFENSWQRLNKLIDDMGLCMVMESLGHGIAWSDNNERHGLFIPQCEIYGYPEVEWFEINPRKWENKYL